MRTRENYKRGKGGREKSRLPGISALWSSFLAVTPKKNPKNAFLAIGYDIL